MADTIKTSITFTIGKEADAATSGVSVEIDGRSAQDGGDNDIRLGKTSGFEPAESIGFLLYYDTSALAVDYIKSTLDAQNAAINRIRAEQITVEETVKFEQRGGSATLGKKAIANTLTLTVIGQEPDGAPTLDSDGVTLKLPDAPTSLQIEASDSDVVKAQKTKDLRKPSTYKAEYKTEAQLYRITVPNRDTMLSFDNPPWPVDVYIYMCEL
jgi:hypothetical protein